MFGGRCQGMCPMCAAVHGWTISRAHLALFVKENRVPLIQVKVVAGVFTTSQKQEIIERLTDALVEIQGENLRQHTWCVIEEIAGDAWGVGGQGQTADDINALASG
jgi:4-oxalocrotonate tautomerase